MLAGRYLRARRKEAFISVISWLTLIGVAIGVATLIVVMSVMNGFRAELLTKILGLNGHFTAYPIDAKFTDYDETAVKLETVDGVLLAIPYVEGQALASGQQESTGVSVRGIEASSIDKLTLLKNGAVLGGWDQWDESMGVAIGQRLAEKLGLTIGDPITIVNPNGANTPFGKTPAIRSFPVNVIFDLGMVEFDSFYVYMPMQAAQTYFKMFEDVLRPGVVEPPPDATDEADRCGLRAEVPGDRRRGVHRRPRQCHGTAQPHPDRRRSLADPLRLAAAQRDLLFGAAGRARGDVHHPVDDHPRGCVQHHLEPRDAGEGQGKRHRDPPHHGRDARLDHAHLLDDRLCDRARWARCSGWCSG